MNTLQQDAVDRLMAARSPGDQRSQVDERRIDEHADVVLPNGEWWVVLTDGRSRRVGWDHSINWDAVETTA